MTPGSCYTQLAKGMYRFRIIDNCGNGIISDVTVDTLLALSMGHQGTFCAGTNAKFYSSPLALESPYLWTGPRCFSSTNDPVFSNVEKYTLTQSMPGCN